MNKLTQLRSRLSKGSSELGTVRTLYRVMEKVGGYEQLMNLSLPSLREIISCMEWESKEISKSNRRKR